MIRVRWTRITGVLTVLVLILAACGEPVGPGAAAAPTEHGLPVLPRNAAGYMVLSVDQLAAGMTSKKFTLVNVHVPDEGNLPNTDLSIPFDRISGHLDKLPGIDAPIVLYCQSGGMSTEAAAALAAAGFTKVYELRGGFNAWRAAGRELLDK